MLEGFLGIGEGVSVWIGVQAGVNLFLLGLILWVKRSHSIKENEQQSRQLQTLQGKIAVLEDLSDKTESQMKELTSLIAKKSQQLKEVIHKAKVQCTHLEKERQKSLEIVEMFQDKIPHEEVIERQRRVQYIRAAQMAHEGVSREEVAQKVGLSESELDLIMKVNHDQLVFEELPSWFPSLEEGEIPSKENKREEG